MLFICIIGGCGMIDSKNDDKWLIRIVWIGLPIMSFIIWYYVVELIIFLINWGV